jgi:SAM-dependent methyltransferase
MQTQAATVLQVRPYSRIAAVYDRSVGLPFFLRARRAFETLVPRYGIRFCSAADIGCGTGLFACYLNRCWGVPVYAVDRSPEMLRQAQRNCPGSGVCFLQQDIRCLHLPAPVDMVTANFDTLNHLVTPDDLRLAFRRVAANLRLCGHFYFDIVTPCQPLGGHRLFVRDFRTPGWCFKQLIRWESARRLMRLQVVHRQAGCCWPAIERFAERAYSAGEIATGLLAAGFVIRGVHDEGTLRVATRCGPRIIVLAQRVADSRRNDDPKFQGCSPENIINRLTTRGIHLEQSFEAREKFRREIARAIGEVFVSRHRFLLCIFIKDLEKKRAEGEAEFAQSLSKDLAAGPIDVESAIEKHKAWSAKDDALAVKIKACEELQTFIEERIEKLKTTQPEGGSPAQTSNNT